MPKLDDKLNPQNLEINTGTGVNNLRLPILYYHPESLRDPREELEQFGTVCLPDGVHRSRARTHWYWAVVDKVGDTTF